MKMEETIKLQSFFKILSSMFFVNAGSEVFYQACTTSTVALYTGFQLKMLEM